MVLPFCFLSIYTLSNKQLNKALGLGSQAACPPQAKTADGHQRQGDQVRAACWVPSDPFRACRRPLTHMIRVSRQLPVHCRRTQHVTGVAEHW